MQPIQYRALPTFTQQWTGGTTNDKNWYLYAQQAEQGLPPGAEMNIVAGASPFTYTAPAKGFVIVSGSGVSSIMFSRTPGQFYTTGTTAGSFPVSQSDLLKITYTGAKPVITFVPT